MNISNNILAGLLIVAIVVGIGGMYAAVNIQTQTAAATGFATGVANVTIPAKVQISLPVNTIDFGNLEISATNDTSDMDPAPFEIKNDGSVNVNITVEATDMFSGTGGANPSTYYQFKSAEKEAGSVVNDTTDLVTTWTNMAATGNAVNFTTNFKFPNANDELYGHIKLTVPDDESAGAKSSTVTFTASQA